MAQTRGASKTRSAPFRVPLRGSLLRLTRKIGLGIKTGPIAEDLKLVGPIKSVMSSAVGYAMNGERDHRRMERGRKVFVDPGFVLENHVRGVCLSHFWRIRMVVARQKRRVCTMCTPVASDQVVHRPDRAGLVMLSGEWLFCEAWNVLATPSWKPPASTT